MYRWLDAYPNGRAAHLHATEQTGATRGRTTCTAAKACRCHAYTWDCQHMPFVTHIAPELPPRSLQERYAGDASQPHPTTSLGTWLRLAHCCYLRFAYRGTHTPHPCGSRAPFRAPTHFGRRACCAAFTATGFSFAFPSYDNLVWRHCIRYLLDERHVERTTVALRTAHRCSAPLLPSSFFKTRICILLVWMLGSPHSEHIQDLWTTGLAHHYL